MADRRQAYRREPIEVDLGEQVIPVGPVSWVRRNDFGNEVMRQHSELLNEAMRIYIDESSDNAVPQVEVKFAEKFKDPYELFKIGLDEATYNRVKAIDDLTFDQIIVLLLAICDVNNLSQLYPLLDPNSLTPTTLGGAISTLAAGVTDTQKTESGPDSSSPESNAQ
jgi:hypothetical protein